MEEKYEINVDTMIIMPINDSQSKILETEDEIIVDIPSNEIINYNCKYYGSSYAGRHEGTKNILGYTYKLPIVIDEVRNIIFFPTCSPRYGKAYWICGNHIKKFEPYGKKIIVTFSNNKKLILDISYRSFETQLLRSTYLENSLRNRRK